MLGREGIMFPVSLVLHFSCMLVDSIKYNFEFFMGRASQRVAKELKLAQRQGSIFKWVIGNAKHFNPFAS